MAAADFTTFNTIGIAISKLRVAMYRCRGFDPERIRAP